MKELHKVMEFCIRYQTILGFGIVSLLTVASELIFSSVAFKCPCNSWNMLYGCSFLLAPAFILFLLGFMVNPMTWRLLTGKCSPEKHRGSSPWGTCAYFWQVLVPMTAKALVAPLTWIAVALFRASFYECAASGNSQTASYYCKDNGTECRKLLLKMPCNETIAADFSTERLSLHAQSQLIGWILLACYVTVALILKCARHFCSPDSYLQLKSWKIYFKKEPENFEKIAEDHATNLAERSINRFFEETEPFRIPTKKDLQEISVVTPFDSQGQEYSMIDKDVNNKLKEGSHGCTDSANGDEAEASV